MNLEHINIWLVVLVFVLFCISLVALVKMRMEVLRRIRSENKLDNALQHIARSQQRIAEIEILKNQIEARYESVQYLHKQYKEKTDEYIKMLTQDTDLLSAIDYLKKRKQHDPNFLDQKGP